MSNFSIAKTYQKLAGQLFQTDADPAALTGDARELAQQIQASLAEQWSATVTAETPTDEEATPAEPVSYELAQRLEYILDWMTLHNRAIQMGLRSSLPSAMIVHNRSIEIVTSNFSLKSIEAMEAAMKSFEEFSFTGGIVKRLQRPE